MPQAKRRIVINAEGANREIMSLLETKNGDLIVNIKKPLARDYGSRTESVVEDRFSIHPSKNTSGCTINRHLKLGDGTYLNGYTHALPASDKFIWPIGIWISQSLSLDRYACKPAKVDTLVELGAYDPSKQTLIFFWVVSSDSRTAPYIAPDPIETICLSFDYFTIWLSWSFLNIPSTPFGTEGIFSGKITENGIDVVGGVPGCSSCPTSSELAVIISNGIANSIDRHESRMHEKIGLAELSSLDYNIFRAIMRMMSKYPIV